MDFDCSAHHVEIDRDVEQTIWVATTADNTQMGWLMCSCVASAEAAFPTLVTIRSLILARCPSPRS
jgi:hypothetical protein